MKIRGIVTLEFRDKDTGELTKTVTAENNVTDYHVEDLICANSKTSGVNYGQFGDFIFISEFNPPASTARIRYIPFCHSLGFNDVGVTSPRLDYGTETNYPYGTVQQRFASPASDININVVGLTYTAALPTSHVLQAQAWLKLPSTLVQTTTETLDVFYRVMFPYDYWREQTITDKFTSKVSGVQADIIANRLFSDYNTPEYFFYFTPYWNGNIDPTGLKRYPRGLNSSPEYYQTFSGDFTITANKETHEMDVLASVPISDGLGIVAGVLTFGDSNSTLANNPFARLVTNPGEYVIQNTFGHDATADVPFFDANQLNTGTAAYTLNGDAWTNPDFPKLYRINVTKSGPVGVAEYTFQVRNAMSFKDNTYKDIGRVIPSMAYENAYLHGGFEFMPPDVSGTQAQDHDIPTFIRYDIDGTLKNLIAINKTQIYPFDLHTERGTLIDSTTYPTFEASHIGEVDYESDGTIYVACRNTGLYKISNATGSPAGIVITKIDNTTTGLTGLAGSPNGVGCFGVAVGNGRIWAAFNGGLFYSTDAGASWNSVTFTNAAITADWSLISYIKADPSHADHRLAIVYDSNTGNLTNMEQTVLWWDTVGASTGVTGKQFNAIPRNILTVSYGYNSWVAEEPHRYFTQLSCSPTQNKWAYPMKSTGWTTPGGNRYGTFLDYGASTYTQNTATECIMYSIFPSWEPDAAGDYDLIHTSVFNINNSVGLTILKDSGTYTYVPCFAPAPTGLDYYVPSYGATCYLGSSVMLYRKTDGEPRYYGLLVYGDPTSNTAGDSGHIVWDTYGWEGSPPQWVKDGTGSKVTHGSTDALHDGLTISFYSPTAGSPADEFVVTDFYTTGVCQGIWLDGSTSFDFDTGLYWKNLTPNQTALEVSTLLTGSPAVRSPEIFAYYPISGVSYTWQDVNLVSFGADVLYSNGSTTLYDHGCRSIEKIPGARTGVGDKSANDGLFGRFIFGLYTNLGSSSNNRITAGLSPVSVIGTSINQATIKYGWEIYGDDVVSLGGHARAVMNGTVVGGSPSSYDIWFNSTYSSSIDFEVEILDDGTVNWYVLNTFGTQPDYVEGEIIPYTRTLYHTMPGAPIEDYYVDVAINGANGTAGLTLSTGGAGQSIDRAVGSYPGLTRRFTHRVPDDRYITIGDFGTSKGRYASNFFAIDHGNSIIVMINGVEATTYLQGDYLTPLGAGEVSVFAREGFIRYSPADDGKTITATYNTLTR